MWPWLVLNRLSPAGEILKVGRKMYPDAHGGTAVGGVCLTARACVAWLLRAKVAPHANPTQLAGGWRPSALALAALPGAGDGDGTSRDAPAGRRRRGGPGDCHPGSVELAALSPQRLGKPAGDLQLLGPDSSRKPSLISLIRHGEAAGVIFFGQNIASRAQIAGVIKRLQQADASPLNPVRAPLLLMTDQEGGQVRRLRGQPDLSEKQIGAKPLPQAKTLATQAGRGAAANLRGAGMNVNLAPVLDVYRQAGRLRRPIPPPFPTAWTRMSCRRWAST